MSEPIQAFAFTPGKVPLLVSMPHAGVALLPGVQASLTNAARSLPDTDWYLPELYAFLQPMQVGVIAANYSRYVVDLNRSLDDKPLYSGKTTGLFPDILFSGEPLFQPGQQPTDAVKAQIKAEIWQPYHQKVASELARLKAEFGYAILFEAHSIAAQVPMLFDGTLPDFNLGNNGGQACAAALLNGAEQVVAASGYSHVCNGRFKGGYLTRHFGQPSQNLHAIQLELSQASYLKTNHTSYQLDQDKLARLQPVLKQLIASLITTAEQGGVDPEPNR